MLLADTSAPLITLYLETVRLLGTCPPTARALPGKNCGLFTVCVVPHPSLFSGADTPDLSAVTSNLPPSLASFFFPPRLTLRPALRLQPAGRVGRQPAWTLNTLTVRRGDVRER